MSENAPEQEAVPEGWVRIRHEKTGMTSLVQESTLPAWATAGWTRAENGSEGEAAPVDSSTEQPEESGDPTEE